MSKPSSSSLSAIVRLRHRASVGLNKGSELRNYKLPKAPCLTNHEPPDLDGLQNEARVVELAGTS